MNSRNTPVFAALGMAFALAATADGGGSQSPRGLLPQIDHLVFGTPDLNVGIDTIEKLAGVRAAPGGQHPGQGTRNALIALGADTYLEILGPDREQPAPDRPRRFGLDDLIAPRLVAWAAKGDDLTRVSRAAVANGIRLGEVAAGSRQTPTGVLLTWSFTNPNAKVADGIVPFFINWGQTPHPARTAPSGASLIALRAEHPDPDSVTRMLGQLGLELSVTKGPRAALIATLQSPRGRVELR